MSTKTTLPAARVRFHTTQAPERLGGETRPYEYPHLYQIQAGDWRISYAVEQNRLAILVLEVLNSDGTVVQDPIHETLTRKMKVKLLDWPEGSPSRDLRPEDLGRKVKIRLMDLAEEAAPAGRADGARPGRVKLSGSRRSRRASRHPARGARGRCEAIRGTSRAERGYRFLRRQSHATRFAHHVIGATQEPKRDRRQRLLPPLGGYFAAQWARPLFKWLPV